MTRKITKKKEKTKSLETKRKYQSQIKNKTKRSFGRQ